MSNLTCLKGWLCVCVRIKSYSILNIRTVNWQEMVWKDKLGMSVGEQIYDDQTFNLIWCLALLFIWPVLPLPQHTFFFLSHKLSLSLRALSTGDFKAHPKDLIVAPCWLKAFKGNELQRAIRKKKMVGDRMMTQDRHNLEKRIRFLYRRFNRTGKHR